LHHVHTVGFNQSGGECLPGWLTELPRVSTVHASLGNIFHRTPGVFTAIIDGLKDQDINLVLAVGRDQDPLSFGPQPANVRIERYIPHALLLPYCDAIITHCGFSSTMACIERGLPMVAIPLAGDQFANAARCVALGAARLVVPDDRTPDVIRAATMEIIGNPRYRESAVRLRREFESLPPVESCVSLLEKLVATKGPVCRE
jgi:MGT family glycosyltransferase